MSARSVLSCGRVGRWVPGRAASVELCEAKAINQASTLCWFSSYKYYAPAEQFTVCWNEINSELFAWVIHSTAARPKPKAAPDRSAVSDGECTASPTGATCTQQFVSEIPVPNPLLSTGTDSELYDGATTLWEKGETPCNFRKKNGEKRRRQTWTKSASSAQQIFRGVDSLWRVVGGQNFGGGRPEGRGSRPLTPGSAPYTSRSGSSFLPC